MQAYNETTNEPQTAIHHKLDSGKVFAFSQMITQMYFKQSEHVLSKEK